MYRHFRPTLSTVFKGARPRPDYMAKAVARAEEEIEREWVEDSLRAYMRRKRGCTENWVRGIMRSSEPETVDFVFREHRREFQSLNGERYLQLAVLWNKGRSGDD